MKNRKIIVVGSGVAGIVAAIMLQKKFGNVYLIEQEKKIGGLFCSKKFNNGLIFDQGSHFIKATGIKDLDKIITQGMNKKKWNVLGNLKGASFFGSKLNSQSPFIDTRRLNKKIYEKGIKEILKIKKILNSHKNLKEQIVNNFGPTFNKHIFDPVINKKSFRCDLKELDINSHYHFGLGRVLAFSPNEARKVKQNKVYDKKFSFHSYSEGQSSLNSYYPKKGGSEEWVKLLKKQLLKLKVKIITNTKVNTISHKKNKVDFITLNGGKKIFCSKVFWTIHPGLFLKLSNITFKNKTNKKIKKIYTTLHHIAVDKNFLTNAQYIQCYDPKFHTYRVTLYPNINTDKKVFDNNSNKLYHLTTEVISHKIPDIKLLEKKIINELYLMKIISKNTKVKFSHSENLLNGIPVPTINLRIQSQKIIKLAKNKIRNVYFLGKASGAYSTSLIMGNAFNEVNKIK
tara:strand:- start:13456 stop:14823 length:1368 start_codon:yes stop_codon:yes gene_type:complete